jgi:hypothetical protein
MGMWWAAGRELDDAAEPTPDIFHAAARPQDLQLRKFGVRRVSEMIGVAVAATLCSDVVAAVAVLEVELVHPIAILYAFFLPVSFSTIP